MYVPQHTQLGSKETVAIQSIAMTYQVTSDISIPRIMRNVIPVYSYQVWNIVVVESHSEVRHSCTWLCRESHMENNTKARARVKDLIAANKWSRELTGTPA